MQNERALTRTGLLEKVEAFQNLLLSYATGGRVAEEEFRSSREEILDDPLLKEKLPRFVRTCRDLKQFWGFIKATSPSYQGRREFLWDQFRPIIESLEEQGSPADEAVSEMLARFDVEHVHQVWTKALERRADDPEGAITSARTLLETVCKHILDESSVAYEDDADLPKLYRLTAETLDLAPNQQSEDIFRRIFGACQSVVENLGALRNKLSDAHGKGKDLVKPDPRHAELAVNLAGAMATFLVQTWQARES